MVREKNKTNTREIIRTILVVILFILLLLMIVVSLSKVKIEGSCEIDNLSFEINETRSMENISLSDGGISCSFKLEVPLWIALIGI